MAVIHLSELALKEQDPVMPGNEKVRLRVAPTVRVSKIEPALGVNFSEVLSCEPASKLLLIALAFPGRGVRAEIMAAGEARGLLRKFHRLKIDNLPKEGLILRPRAED